MAVTYGLDTNVMVGYILGPADKHHKNAMEFFERTISHDHILPIIATQEYDYVVDGVGNEKNDGLLADLVGGLSSFICDMQSEPLDDIFSAATRKVFLQRLTRYDEKVRRFVENHLSKISNDSFGTGMILNILEKIVMGIEKSSAERKMTFLGSVEIYDPKKEVETVHAEAYKVLEGSLEDFNDRIVVLQVHDYIFVKGKETVLITEDGDLHLNIDDILACTKITDILDLKLRRKEFEQDDQ
jgi:hypothetical protein